MSFWRSRQGVGIVLIVVAALFFATLDASIKHAALLAPVLMLLWFRYAFQALATLALRFPVQKFGLLATANPRFQLLRGVLLLVTSACSFLGLQYLPVGEFTAMTMLSPVAATALAAWVLKTHVSHQRWLLLIAGLTGVLLVVRPGGQVFSWALLFPALHIIGFATLFGWLFFSHVPDTLAWLGIAVIASSGIGNALLLSREVHRPLASSPGAARR